MAGTIHRLLTRLIEERTGGNPHLAAAIKIKLIMKGVDPDLHDKDSEDDPLVIARLHAVAREMSVDLRVNTDAPLAFLATGDTDRPARAYRRSDPSP